MTSIMETTSILLEAIRESSLADVKDFLIASDIAAEDQNIALIGGGPTGVTANGRLLLSQSSPKCCAEFCILACFHCSNITYN